MIGTNQNEGLLSKTFSEETQTVIKRHLKFFIVMDLLPFSTGKRMKFVKKNQKCAETMSNNILLDQTLLLKENHLKLSSKCMVIFYSMIAAHNDAPPIYHYIYNHRGPFSFMHIMSLPPCKLAVKIASLLLGLNLFKTSGVCHFDELFMMFKPHAIPTTLNKRVSENLINM